MGVLSHMKNLNWTSFTSNSNSGLNRISLHSVMSHQTLMTFATAITLPITLFIGFIAVGIGLGSSMEITLALMLYSIPFYLISTMTFLAAKDPSVRVLIGFGLGTISLSLLFGFTPLAAYPLLFWLLGVIFNAVVLFTVSSGGQQSEHSTSRKTPRD